MDKQHIKKEYTNGEITIVWQSSLCIHSGMCVKSLSSVFKPQTSPWIQMENATTEEIMAVVSKCPSGALQYYKNEE
jgi:uncharacterized Fe-S cluster protein YjdI